MVFGGAVRKANICFVEIVVIKTRIRNVLAHENNERKWLFLCGVMHAERQLIQRK